MVVHPYGQSDRVWAKELLNAEFGGRHQARRGELIDVLALPGFVAEQDGRPVGILTYRREGDACELAFIAARERHRGIGSVLLDALCREVADCERTWLVTTNDNLEALRFVAAHSSSARLSLLDLCRAPRRLTTDGSENPVDDGARLRGGVGSKLHLESHGSPLEANAPGGDSWSPETLRKV